MNKYLIGSGFIIAATVIVSLSHPAWALPTAATDIYGSPLRDGDLISANVSAGDPDIFIIKLKPFTGYAHPGTDYGEYNGFKRLFLNPAIFNMYGHLGGFSRVRQVTAAVRDSFVTSGLFRNCETDDRRVWATEVTGEDNGILHHMQLSGEQAAAEDARFFDKVFCINSREDAFYPKSITPYYRLADVPVYFRRACLVRPACLDAEPRCLLPEPIEGWCPRACTQEGGSPDIFGDPPCCSGLTLTGMPESDRKVCVRPSPTPPPGCHYEDIAGCLGGITGSCRRLVCPSVTPTPNTGPVTVRNVSIAADISPRQHRAIITGYLPTPCYELSHAIAQGAYRYYITLTATSTLGPDQGACAQVIQDFTYSVPLNPGYELSVGSYLVYVNEQYWASFSQTGY